MLNYSAAHLPGVFFEAQPPPQEMSPLRTDVAGFLGATKRGPLLQPVRIDGWAHFESIFGGFDSDLNLPHALYGYFENGGEIAHVMRVQGQSAAMGTADWLVGDFDPQTGQWRNGAPRAGGFKYARYELTAATPGDWSRGTAVKVIYRRSGPVGNPLVDLVIRPPDEPVEYLFGLDPKNLPVEIAQRSRYIRMHPSGDFEVKSEQITPPGPIRKTWEFKLSGGNTDRPSLIDYQTARQRLQEVTEVAIVAAPDVFSQLSEYQQQIDLLVSLILAADDRKDQIVVLDTPPSEMPIGIQEWLAALRNATKAQGAQSSMRAAAVYYPCLRVLENPLAVRSETRDLPSSGHVAGVISRLDRERGAHYTPANASLWEAFDIGQCFAEPDQAAYLETGLNLIRCVPGKGLQIWGGRTLVPRAEGGIDAFISYRRLIHRLVRAIRRVAEPLVFETNGPDLWLRFVRSVTTVLLEAYRAGALKGTRADEAFRVTCDDTTNPPEQIDLGWVLCEIELAPSVPLEFITLRIALSADGQIEAIE